MENSALKGRIEGLEMMLIRATGRGKGVTGLWN